MRTKAVNCCTYKNLLEWGANMERTKSCISCQGGWNWDATIKMYQRCTRCFGYGYMEARRKTKLA